MPPSAPISLEIHDIAFGGKGVARLDGKVYFVPFTIPGERVTARVTRQKKNFAEADLVAVQEASPSRVKPPCPYFARCGGCSYQHIDYARQVEIKSNQVEQTLRRVGKMAEVPMRPAIAAAKPYGYRNRIRVHSAGGLTGFFASDAHALIDVEECLLAVPEVNRALKRLRGTPVQEGDYSLRAPGGGGPYFEQTNPEVTLAMVEVVRSNVRGSGTLVDAYCGAGLFAKALVDRFEKVIGIEANSAAIESARRTAGPAESYIAGDVSANLGEVLSYYPSDKTTVLLDPPAEGLDVRVGELLLGAAPAEIIYVSCNPATLARDLLALHSSYEVLSVTPIDMFPQTAEIEAIVHLARRELAVG